MVQSYTPPTETGRTTGLDGRTPHVSTGGQTSAPLQTRKATKTHILLSLWVSYRPAEMIHRLNDTSDYLVVHNKALEQRWVDHLVRARFWKEKLAWKPVTRKLRNKPKLKRSWQRKGLPNQTNGSLFEQRHIMYSHLRWQPYNLRSWWLYWWRIWKDNQPYWSMVPKMHCSLVNDENAWSISSSYGWIKTLVKAFNRFNFSCTWTILRLLFQHTAGKIVLLKISFYIDEMNLPQ